MATEEKPEGLRQAVAEGAAPLPFEQEAVSPRKLRGASAGEK